jgi:hypothetical protein
MTFATATRDDLDTILMLLESNQLPQAGVDDHQSLYSSKELKGACPDSAVAMMLEF